jgi:hypothetical protein
LNINGFYKYGANSLLIRDFDSTIHFERLSDHELHIYLYFMALQPMGAIGNDGIRFAFKNKIFRVNGMV